MSNEKALSNHFAPLEFAGGIDAAGCERSAEVIPAEFRVKLYEARQANGTPLNAEQEQELLELWSKQAAARLAAVNLD